MSDRCRTYEVDGRPVRVLGGDPLTEEDRAALAELIRAAQAKAAVELTPEIVQRQEAAMARNRERLQRLGMRR